MRTEHQAMAGRARERLLVGAGITLLVLAGALVFSWRFTERMRAMVRQYQARLEQKKIRNCASTPASCSWRPRCSRAAARR